MEGSFWRGGLTRPATSMSSERSIQYARQRADIHMAQAAYAERSDNIAIRSIPDAWLLSMTSDK